MSARDSCRISDWIAGATDLTGVRSSFGGNFHSRSRRHHFVDSTNGSRALSAPTHNQGEPRDQEKAEDHFAETGFIKPGIEA